MLLKGMSVQIAKSIFWLLLILAFLYPWARYAHLSFDCSTTWLKPKEARIIGAVPLLPTLGVTDVYDDDDNRQQFYYLELQILLGNATTCSSKQTSKRFYCKQTAETAASAMIGNATTVVQSYWTPEKCFDFATADRYFQLKFWRSKDLVLFIILSIAAFAFGCFAGWGYISQKWCFPNENWDRVTLRPTVAERLCEKYSVTIFCCVCITPFVWGLQLLLRRAVHDLLMYSPRVLMKERGIIEAATPVLMQTHGYIVGDDAPEAEYCIHESIRLSSSSFPICTIERNKLLFNPIANATAYAASRIGQNITVWRSWYDPALCSDQDNSSANLIYLNACIFGIVFTMLIICGLLWVAWWFSDKKHFDTETVGDYDELRITISDKYAQFQTLSMIPKTRVVIVRQPSLTTEDDGSDTEAPKDK